VPNLSEMGAAYATLAAAVIATPAYLWYLRKQVGIGTMLFLGAIARPMLASVVMLLVLRHVLPVADALTGAIWQALLLVFAVVLGAVVYTTVMTVTWLALGRPRGAEQIALDQMRRALARKRTPI